ncbi:hypothetical protein Q2T40_20790 [Winogradskyella maritima]|uniref:Anti-sigma factor n=1 Tax=Winogradskyella maritima TaxID=1517766 RepID=A0ABV8AMC5_9FLAO|nr:hypothetical protein [Winogradskyella maritima]MDO1502581.1 hypothetical protein [Winogradskyella maritima]
MAPIKFEENMKETLEKRTMSPSPELWSKLADRLDEDEKKNRKPVYWWLGIAASVAVLIMLSIGFFNSNTEEIIDVLVEEEVPKQERIKETLNPVELIEDKALAGENLESPKIEKEVVVSSKKDKSERQNQLQKEITTTPIKSKDAVAQVDKSQQAPILNKEKLNFDKSEVDKAVAEVLKFKEDKNTVTDQQIDSLLKSAQRELFKDRIFKNSNNVVDADALLQDVEDDLGLSFRTKVYEALKDGYEKAKTAVANRNN